MEELLCDAALRGDLALLHDITARDVYILDKVLVGSFKGKNPLHVAISTGRTKFVLELLEIKPDLAEVLDTEQGAALHVASAKGNVEIVKALVDISPKMCLARDRDGNNPLHIAAIKGQVQVLKELVQTSSHRAQVKVDQGDTISHLCVKYYQLDCLELLLKMIPDPDFVNDVDIDGNTILHLAVFEKRLEMIKLVLSNTKIEVNAVNNSGQTALDIHSLAGNSPDLEIQNILLNAGAKRSEQASVAEVEHLEPSWQANRRNTLMVVASLIATMAFQVGANPPGGVWPDNSGELGVVQLAGTAIIAYSNPYWYRMFLYVNTIGLLVSLSTILLLIVALPERSTIFSVARGFISGFIIVMTAYIYVFSVASVVPAEIYQIIHSLQLLTHLWTGVTGILLWFC